jgi:hypothetical protein
MIYYKKKYKVTSYILCVLKHAELLNELALLKIWNSPFKVLGILVLKYKD